MSGDMKDYAEVTLSQKDFDILYAALNRYINKLSCDAIRCGEKASSIERKDEIREKRDEAQALLSRIGEHFI